MTTPTGRFVRYLVLGAVTGVLAGCGGLSSSEKPTEAAAVTQAQDPLAKPIQVAFTSARAIKCEFYFQPEKLKSDYLASEARHGAGAEQLSQFERAYNAAFKKFTNVLADQSDYCKPPVVDEIRADLKRHLAGDYTPQIKKKDKPAEIIHLSPKKKLDPEDFFDPDKQVVN